MPKNVTTVTHPDGTVSKRTSVRAIYTHAVVVEPGTPEGVAAGHRAKAAEAFAQARQIRAAVAGAKFTRKSRMFRPDDADTVNSFDYNLVGTEVRGAKGHTYYAVSDRGTSDGVSQCARQFLSPTDVVVGEDASVRGGFGPTNYSGGGAEGYLLVETTAHVLAQGVRRAEQLEESAAKSEEKAQAAERGEGLGGYGVLRWSSRRDLAEKAASGEYARLATSGWVVRVVPVDAN